MMYDELHETVKAVVQAVAPDRLTVNQVCSITNGLRAAGTLMTDAEMAVYTHMEAWETEYPSLVVWGTHDPATAAAVAGRYYRETLEPSDYPSNMYELLREASVMWGSPRLVSFDEAPWPPSLLARQWFPDGFHTW